MRSAFGVEKLELGKSDFSRLRSDNFKDFGSGEAITVEESKNGIGFFKGFKVYDWQTQRLEIMQQMFSDELVKER